MRRLLSGLAVCFGLVALVVAVGPAAAAPPPRCLVINEATNSSYESVQEAVDGATFGNTLWCAARAPDRS